MSLRLTIAAAAIAAVCAAAAARTASDFFSQAPDAVLPLLPQSTRLDMLDYFNFGSSKTSANHLGGQSCVTEVSDRVVSYRLSERGSGQLAVVPFGTDTLLAVVTTLSTPVPDSSIDWYKADWTQIPAPVAIPKYTDWLTPAGRADEDHAHSMAPFLLISAEFTPDASSLNLTNHASSYVAAADSAAADSLFIPKKSITPRRK